jgi:hypothetical protein
VDLASGSRNSHLRRRAPPYVEKKVGLDHFAEPIHKIMPRTWFEKWREPGEFYRAADTGLAILCKELACDERRKFSPPQYLCDAFHAAWFARVWRDAQGPCKVRLAPEDPPDAQLKPAMALPDGYRPYIEMAEVHRATSPKPITTTDEEHRERRRGAIAAAVRKKCGKPYPADTTLVIVADASLSCEEMKRLTEPAKDCFAAIYLLCDMDVVRAWPDLCVLRGEEGF